MTGMDRKGSWRIGEWCFDDTTQILERGEDRVRLDPIDVSVLLHLAEAAPALVTRDELLARSWPGVVVGDNVVHREIARLRKALGDQPRNPVYIETLPKRGYRMVAAVEALAAIPASESIVIAVLPFDRPTGDETAGIIGDGLADDLLNGLVRHLSVQVIARTSAFQFKSGTRGARELGDVLGASHIVEGSVRTAGTEARITARLIRAADGTQLWSDQYTREFANLFALQDEITAEVLRMLDLYFKAPALRSPVDPAAYTVLVEAMRATDTGGWDASHTHLQRCLALAPGFAAAHGHLAMHYIGRIWVRRGAVSQHIEAIEQHAAQALALDPGERRGRLATAHLRFFYHRDFQAGIDLCHELAVQFPNDTLVLVELSAMLRSLGRETPNRVCGERLSFVDPLNPFTWWRVADDALWSGRYATARSALERARMMGLATARMEAQLALVTDEEEELEALLELPVTRWDMGGGGAATAVSVFQLLARAEQACLLGNEDLAERLDELREAVAPPWLGIPAKIALMEGDIEPRLGHLEYEITETWAGIMEAQPTAAVHPDEKRYPAYYNDVRRREILDRYGLNPADVARVSVPALPF